MQRRKKRLRQLAVAIPAAAFAYLLPMWPTTMTRPADAQSPQRQGQQSRDPQRPAAGFDLPAPPPGASLAAIAFADIPGWAHDDHAAAYRTFLATCRRLASDGADLRPGKAPPESLVALCREALAAGERDAAQARVFFEERFVPLRITPANETGRGFLTGYYEPEMEGSLTPAPDFPVPALGRPDDLVTFRQGETPAPLDPALAAARRTASGLEPYADRGAIDDGALAGRGLELLYVRDRVELFMAQVQGSARVRLADGRVLRLVYTGRNGLPYTSIGKVIVSEGHMDLETMTLAKLKDWLRANPADAQRIMRLNRSYIFFAIGEGLDPAAGPIGAASVPLTPLRSIAVDRSLWPYGLPFWISATLPLGPDGSAQSFGQLMIAQDTGSAILGPARADLFLGSGAEAGAKAGLIRHPGEFTVLWPRGTARP